MFYGSGGSFEPRFEVTLTSTIVSDFFMPRDYSRGGIKICPCLSVRPFVTLNSIEFV